MVKAEELAHLEIHLEHPGALGIYFWIFCIIPPRRHGQTPLVSVQAALLNLTTGFASNTFSILFFEYVPICQSIFEYGCPASTYCLKKAALQLE